MGKKKNKQGKKKLVTQIFPTAHPKTPLALLPGCDQQDKQATRELLNGSYEYDMGRSPWQMEPEQSPAACKLWAGGRSKENLQGGAHASWTLRQIEEPQIRTASSRAPGGTGSNNFFHISVEIERARIQCRSLCD